ncbi:MAG: hypothetical protein Q9201_003171 [Fulgogasparrea decipioides]
MHHPTRNEIAAIIANVREVIMKRANSTPLSVRQKASLEESSAAGPWCVSQTSLPAPPQEEGDATDVLMRATEMLEQEAKKRSAPSAQDVKAEWLSYREDGGPPGAASEQASYDWISAKTRGQPTIFYIQGGAFVSASPLVVRKIICSLALQAEFTSQIPIHDLQVGRAYRWAMLFDPLPPRTTASLSGRTARCDHCLLRFGFAKSVD